MYLLLTWNCLDEEIPISIQEIHVHYNAKNENKINEKKKSLNPLLSGDP